MHAYKNIFIQCASTGQTLAGRDSFTLNFQVSYKRQCWKSFSFLAIHHDNCTAYLFCLCGLFVQTKYKQKQKSILFPRLRTRTCPVYSKSTQIQYYKYANWNTTTWSQINKKCSIMWNNPWTCICTTKCFAS